MRLYHLPYPSQLNRTLGRQFRCEPSRQASCWPRHSTDNSTAVAKRANGDQCNRILLSLFLFRHSNASTFVLDRSLSPIHYPSHFLTHTPAHTLVLSRSPSLSTSISLLSPGHSLACLAGSFFFFSYCLYFLSFPASVACASHTHTHTHTHT